MSSHFNNRPEERSMENILSELYCYTQLLKKKCSRLLRKLLNKLKVTIVYFNFQTINIVRHKTF